MSQMDEGKDPNEPVDVGSRSEGILPEVQWSMSYHCMDKIKKDAPAALAYLKRAFGTADHTDISDALGITNLK